MKDTWHETLPVLDKFSQVADPAEYAALPDDWIIGISDVVNSTAAIAAGRYKAVNLAGAGTISAVSNSLNGDLHLFTFGGDGARFVVSSAQIQCTANALSRAAIWAERDLGLDLRVGSISVAEVRAAGFDVRAAFWQASNHVRYAMFTGSGLEWAETQLKSGSIYLNPTSNGEEPNLTGLSCQWGSVPTQQGTILSLIVKPSSGGSQANFARIVSRTIALLEETSSLSPVPRKGPDVRWPSSSITLQSRIAHENRPIWLRRFHVLATAALSWRIFKLGLRVGRFDPARYRKEIALNTDFRKFDDALMMTVDCSTYVVESLRAILDEASAAGTIR